MTKGESDRIFASLRRYYPNAKIYGDVDRLEAFRARLLHYDFSEVVAVAKAYVDKNKFFPDLPDLVGKLTPADAPPEGNERRKPEAWMDKYIDALDRSVEATGGVCQLLHNFGGMVGETIRTFYPHQDYCGEKCRKVAYYGKCPFEYMTHKGD